MSGPTGPWSAPGGAQPSPTGPDAPAASPPGRAPLERELVHRPGLFPLRPLGLGEIFGAAVGIYRRRPRIVFGVSAIVLGIAFVLNSVASGVAIAPTAVQLQSISQGPGAGGSADDPSSVLGGSLGEVLATVGSSVATGLITLAAMQLVLIVLTRVALVEATGGTASDADLRATLRTHGWRAVLTALLVSLMGFAPFLVLSLLGGLPLLIVQEAHWWTIVPLPVFLVLGLLAALWVWIRTAFATPSLVIEDLGVRRAIGRSFALTRGRRLWRALGIAVLLTVCFTLVQQAIGTVFGTIGMILYAVVLLATQGTALVLGMILLTIVTMIGTYVASVIAAPFWAAGLTALYADLRMRHESWDIALRRAQHETGGDVAVGAR